MLLLGGCNGLGPWNVWTSTASSLPTAGPMGVGGIRHPVLARSRVVVDPYANRLSYAFQDSSGRNINVFASLLPDLDAYTERIDELKPWVTRPGTHEFRQGRNYPFKMFLLTISPAIVLVVPQKIDSSNAHCDTLFLQGCLQSQSFRGSEYWFRGTPKVANGSFWFSPEEKNNKIHRLDETKRVEKINVGQSIVELTKIDGEWQVNRIK
jgi:hypothetical protein